MNAQVALFEQGHRPVFRVLPSRPCWSRVSEPVEYQGGKGSDFAIHVRHLVDSSPGETIYFAFCYPYSYGDLCAKLAWIDALFDLPPAQVALLASDHHKLEAAAGGSNSLAAAALRAALEANTATRRDDMKHANETAAASATFAAASMPSQRPLGVYYRRELLTYSVEGRRIELITITGHRGGARYAEPPLDPPLLPETHRQRPSFFPKKRVILVTSRVHPGETPASFVVDGLLELLLRADDPVAIRLRAKFVFKIIPMLNPDGVYEGRWRSDTLGVNLNRLYAKARQEAQPSIHAALAVARQHHEAGQLLLTMDIHAHAGKRGCFLYGNLPPHWANQQDGLCLDGALYARLLALSSPHLDFDSCVFYAGDGRHDGAPGGSGREALFAATGLPLVFTLECNYNTGRRVNVLPPQREEQQASSCEPAPSSAPPSIQRKVASRLRAPTSPAGGSPSSRRPGGPSPSPLSSAPVVYTPAAWRNVGEGIGRAALDLLAVNPSSRVPGPSVEEGLDELRRPLRDWLRMHSVSVAKGKGQDRRAEDSEEEVEEELEVLVEEEKP